MEMASNNKTTSSEMEEFERKRATRSIHANNTES